MKPSNGNGHDPGERSMPVPRFSSATVPDLVEHPCGQFVKYGHWRKMKVLLDRAEARIAELERAAEIRHWIETGSGASPHEQACSDV